MGRPINSRVFGLPTTNSGPKIQFSSCWISGEIAPVTTAYIVKQWSTNRYIAENPVTGATGIVELVQTITGVNQAIIAVTSTGPAQTAMRITASQVITYEGNRFNWQLDGSTASGKADITSIVISVVVTDFALAIAAFAF